MRTAVTRYYNYVGFDRCADFLNFRQQSLMVCSAEAQLLGSKAYVGIGYARQLFDFIFHFGSAVGTAKVLQNIYTLNFIGIRHTAGAISQAFAAYIAVLLMRMADFAITVSRMTGNVMSVYMSMFVAVVMSAATLVTVCVSMFMLVAVVVTTTACVAVRVSVFVLVAVVMSAAAFVAVRMCVSVFFIFMLMIITTAAIIAMLMGMLFMVMVMIVVVSATTSIAMSMLRHMSHSFMIMILTAVTAGAALRMLAVILYTIDMAVNMTKCSYIAGTVTDIFQIFLHCIYHLSFQVVSLFI